MEHGKGSGINLSSMTDMFWMRWVGESKVMEINENVWNDKLEIVQNKHKLLTEQVKYGKIL